jgi:hypothetical protein
MKEVPFQNQANRMSPNRSRAGMNGTGLPVDLLDRLRAERAARLKGGLYHQTQVALCYNSNRIEGSRLSAYATTPEFLLDTCRSAQDRYAAWVRYFEGKSS